MKKLVNKGILHLYDKYKGDLGLLDERWASSEDRDQVSNEQAQTLGEYIDLLHFVKVQYLSEDLKNKTVRRIKELEKFIDDEVIGILKERIKNNK